MESRVAVDNVVWYFRASMMTRCLIVGGGIGGFALVAAIDSNDIAVDMVEKSRRFAPVGVGIVLHPNGIAALDRLGIDRDVVARGTILDALEIIRDGSTMRLPFRRIWEGSEHRSIGIHRADLHDVLFAAARKRRPELTVRMGTTVRAVEPSGDHLAVTFDDGSEGMYDLVIGADGVDSTIRHLRFKGFGSEELGLHYCRFPATVETPETVWRTWEQGPNSFGFIPIGGNLVHCFVQSTRPFPGDVDEIVSMYAPIAAAYRRRTGPAHVGSAKRIWPHPWRDGRCVLLGDSSHALSPTFSEGGALAMEDAVVLGHVLSSFDLDEGLRHYVALRAPRCAWAARMANAQARNTQSRAPVDSAVATEFLRQMYRPLLDDILGGLPNTARACA